METHLSRTDDAWLEQLSAYLDGELDPHSAAEVERLLSSDENARRDLQRLERAWAALDQLPRAELTGAFVQSTVEMIALQEMDTASPTTPKVSLGSWLLRVGFLLALSLTAALSYVTIEQYLDRENRQLLKDLPVIERLDAYRQVDDVEFLRQLHRSGVFSAGSKSREP